MMRMAVLISAAVALMIPSPSMASCEIDSTIMREVIAYLEGVPPGSPGEKTFVTFDFFGCSLKGSTMRVYGYQLHQGFKLADDQIVDAGGGSGPVVVILEREDDGFTPARHEEPEDGSWAQDIRKIFPKKYWDNAFGKLPKHLLGETRERVTLFYAKRMPEDRFILKARPQNILDPHKHHEPIYDYMNLKVIFERLTIQKNPEYVARTGGGGPVTTSDGLFSAWVGVRRGFHLYFQENKTSTVYELAYRRNRYSNVTWKDNHTLVYDLRNGGNTFGDGEDHGVHIELDVSKKEIIWAVPYGPLGVPKKSAETE